MGLSTQKIAQTRKLNVSSLQTYVFQTGDSMSDNSAPAMDYEMHEATYEGFINFSKVGVVAVLNIVLCLILFAFGGTAATIFGWIMLIATLVAGAVGLALGAKGWVPSAVVFGLTVVLAILTV
jgi:hypothetical protein